MATENLQKLNNEDSRTVRTIQGQATGNWYTVNTLGRIENIDTTDSPYLKALGWRVVT
jgi:hypothetical protein